MPVSDAERFHQLKRIRRHNIGHQGFLDNIDQFGKVGRVALQKRTDFTDGQTPHTLYGVLRLVGLARTIQKPIVTMNHRYIITIFRRIGQHSGTKHALNDPASKQEATNGVLKLGAGCNGGTLNMNTILMKALIRFGSELLHIIKQYIGGQILHARKVNHCRNVFCNEIANHIWCETAN